MRPASSASVTICAAETGPASGCVHRGLIVDVEAAALDGLAQSAGQNRRPALVLIRFVDLPAVAHLLRAVERAAGGTHQDIGRHGVTWAARDADAAGERDLVAAQPGDEILLAHQRPTLVTTKPSKINRRGLAASCVPASSTGVSPERRQRTVRKKARTSSTSSCGCSMAAKWPPRGIVVHRVML